MLLFTTTTFCFWFQCHEQNTHRSADAQQYFSKCPFPVFTLSVWVSWVTHPFLVNKTCLFRVTHVLCLSPPGLNLTSAVSLTIWKAALAFVKPPPCVYCSSVTHGASLISKPLGARKNKNQRKHVFCCLNMENTTEKEKLTFVFVSTMCTDVLEFRILSHKHNCSIPNVSSLCSSFFFSQTPMNQASTRSHCIFTVHLCRREPGSATVHRSKLHLVDLAGSDRVSKTGLNGQLLTEAKYINLSLHYLEQVETLSYLIIIYFISEHLLEKRLLNNTINPTLLLLVAPLVCQKPYSSTVLFHIMAKTAQQSAEKWPSLFWDTVHC